MKKRHLSSLLVLVLLAPAIAFGIPYSAFATSGACSHHGGVDCSAGPGAYGQVICTDGWTRSSVSYDSMVKCQRDATAYHSMPVAHTYAVPPAQPKQQSFLLRVLKWLKTW
jgi:hypothetical protein